jgi:hypothetical protein
LFHFTARPFLEPASEFVFGGVFERMKEPPIEEKSPNLHFPSDKCLSIPSLAESRARLPKSNRIYGMAALLSPVVG